MKNSMTNSDGLNKSWFMIEKALNDEKSLDEAGEEESSGNFQPY
jgi:hypothetical protein